MAKFRAVAAIDFGSTKSGYAFSFYDPKNIEINAFEYDDNYEKTNTTILLQGEPENTQLISFGKEAVHQLAHSEVFEDARVYAFNHFKMDLYTQVENMVSHKGVEVPAIDVISHSIKFIARAALDHMNRTPKGKALSIDEVHWVITVPAIWSQAANQKMRCAAIKAGLPKSLMLALEPEAAALHCRNQQKGLTFSPGTKYGVIDCGGASVDMVFHEIDAKGNTHELLPPTGGPWGSTMVDRNFQKLLEEIFGANQLDANKCAMINLLEQFELRKMIFSPVQRGATEILLPADFTPKYLVEYNKKYSSTVRYDNQKLYIPASQMNSFFSEPVDDIVDCLKKALAALNGKTLNYIFLVGGFARNSILLKRIQLEFENSTTKVISPEFPNMAVLEGAVHLGISPDISTSRVSAYTYGIRGKRLFDEQFDPPELVENIDGVRRCRNTFFIFVRANERVNQGQELVQYFRPVRRNQTRIVLPIFAADDAKEIYISGKMEEIGTVVIELPKEAVLKKPKIKVTMAFRGTEITVVAEYMPTGTLIASTNVTFSYLASFMNVDKVAKN